MLCLKIVDVITSTDWCLYGSFCAVDVWYLGWSFKPPVSYVHITRHPTAWVLLHLAPGTGDAMTYTGTCITSFRANAANLSSSWNSLPFKPPLTDSDHRHVHCRVHYLLQASWISLLFAFQVTKNERQVMKPLYDRYRLVKQILSRANTIPIIVSRAFFWGLFFLFWSWGNRNHHTLAYNTVTKAKSQPPLSLKDQANEWVNDTPYTEVGQSCSRDSSASWWAMGHISPCVVSPFRWAAAVISSSCVWLQPHFPFLTNPLWAVGLPCCLVMQDCMSGTQTCMGPIEDVSLPGWEKGPTVS